MNMSAYFGIPVFLMPQDCKVMIETIYQIGYNIACPICKRKSYVWKCKQPHQSEMDLQRRRENLSIGVL
jgi:hypothetical protein